jgi:hypothetical protein
MIQKQVIAFVASHFYEIERSFLSPLLISTLEAVLSHESLRIQGEYSLYDCVISVIANCKAPESLLERIHLESLSTNVIQRFLSWSDGRFDEICLSLSLWQVLSVRLALTVLPSHSHLRLAIPTFSSSTDGSLN